MVRPETCKKVGPLMVQSLPESTIPKPPGTSGPCADRHLAGLVQVNDIAGRVAQEWTPAGTALSDGPCAAKVAEVNAYDTGDALGYDSSTYAGAQRLTDGDRSPIGDRTPISHD